MRDNSGPVLIEGAQDHRLYLSFHREGTAHLSCSVSLPLRTWHTKFQLPLPLAKCLAHRQDYYGGTGGGCALI